MVDWNSLTIGQHRITCPSCGRNPKDKSASLKIDLNGFGIMHCFRCGHKELRKPNGTSTFQQSTDKPKCRPQVERHTTLSEWGHMIWNQCQPISGMAQAYLNHRNCVTPPKDGHLRWHADLKHTPSGYRGAALVGLVTDALTREPLSLHRTWITSTGKADVTPPRLLLANHSLANGVVRLWPDEYVTHGLAIAEGIETALSLAHGFEPVWAAIDANHLAKFPVVRSVEALLIARDNDPAGIKAAKQCAARWVTAGREVRITNQDKNDINDMVTNG